MGSESSRMSAEPRCVSVSLVSNSNLLRDGLAGILASQLDVRVEGTYSGQIPADRHLPHPSGHVVLLDAAIGLDATLVWIRYWRSQTPPAHVLVLELANDIDMILALIEGGADGYLLQGANVAELAGTIVGLLQGRTQCSPEVTAQLFARLAARTPLAASIPLLNIRLTDRELEVLHYIAQDCSNQQIAEQLFIEVRTVKHHVHNILEKLHVQHRWDAARVGLEQGWLTVS